MIFLVKCKKCLRLIDYIFPLKHFIICIIYYELSNFIKYLLLLASIVDIANKSLNKFFEELICIINII